jgi:hypothetical protein
VKDALPEDLRGIVIEITEHELVADLNELRPRLKALRARGARIAVDDAGAGYAGLSHLVRIRPDLIKLDRSLIEGIDADPAKAALAECFVQFARSTGAGLCAEGIETLEELRAIADIDVATGQGYVLARPAAPWVGVSPEAAVICHVALAEALAGGGTTSATDGLPLIEAISRRLSGVMALDEVSGVTEDVRTGIGADEVALSLWDRDADAVVTLSTDSWSPTGEAFALSDYPVTRYVLEQQRALAVRRDDPGADPKEVALLESGGHRALLMVPIVARGRALGVLEVYARDDRPWSRSDIRRLRLVCNQLGPVIESHTRLAV